MRFDLQKANMWKRISAYLFDIILIAIAVVGFALLLSTLLGYDGYTDRLSAIYETYASAYDVDFDLTSAEYAALPAETVQRYNEALEALSADAEISYVYSMLINLTLIIITFSFLLAYLLFDFLIPLLFGNGQTLGKKVFGIGVMRVDGVRLSPMLLFVRTVLGKYTVETMIPVLIVIMLYFQVIGVFGTVVIALLLAVQLVLLTATKTNSLLHDILAQTVTVDMASQMIFENREEMLAYTQAHNTEQPPQNHA